MTQHFGQVWGVLTLKTPNYWHLVNWNIWGITVQMSYEEGRWHHNWACTSPTIFLQGGPGNWPKSYFLCNTTYPKIFHRNFSGTVPTESLCKGVRPIFWLLPYKTTLKVRIFGDWNVNLILHCVIHLKKTNRRVLKTLPSSAHMGST